jgi:hypothetical protein
MASLTQRSASDTSQTRSLLLGALLILLIPAGLMVMNNQEASFYRTHGLVTDERTAIRLAEMVLSTADHRACGTDADPAATLRGNIWTVEVRPDNGAAACIVQLDRRDGQVLRIDARP